ncbi:MAG TPA: ScyD/ScyE family protein, partial [Actinomycetota bacterium]|nr:ScyD/ScyE family protein [Actinomycetota bacterium]
MAEEARGPRGRVRRSGRRGRPPALMVTIALVILAIPVTAAVDEPFAGPLFGLGTDVDGGVVVADAGRGVARADGTLIAELPGVTDVTASDQGWLWAITGLGAPKEQELFKVTMDGTVTEFADLGAYEAKHNPHPAEVDSNPFSVIDLGGGEAAVADAGGNTLLKVDKRGKVKLIAVLPDELVPTDNAKAIIEEIVGNLLGQEVSCEEGLPAEAPPEAQEICELPDMIPAEPVATSVAIGPDGDLYVSELKGFPAPLGRSRVWRISSNARNADCGRSPLCSVAYEGFTSIVDLS